MNFFKTISKKNPQKFLSEGLSFVRFLFLKCSYVGMVLLARGDAVVGIDNHNNYTHLRIDLADRAAGHQRSALAGVQH